ncbi:MAG TPA: hypothetical protein VJH92_05480 [Candidatus Nanoarchaeia archaeon]|nr:hypothetical protein [Candidatus Nanoarchaeia archaeon]
MRNLSAILGSGSLIADSFIRFNNHSGIDPGIIKYNSGSFLPVVTIACIADYFWKKVAPKEFHFVSNYIMPAFTASLGIGAEIFQKYGAYPGVFDEKDMISAALGGITSVAINKLSSSKHILEPKDVT